MMDRRRATAVVGLLALLAVPAASLALAAACGPSARPPAPARPVAAPPAPPAPASARPDPEPWRAARPAPAAGSQIHYPDPVRSQLPNGMTLLVVQRPAPVVALAVVARSGAGAVPAGKSGLAALTARMMTEATRHRASLALAEAAESLGSSLEHDAGRDSMRVGLTVLRADLEPALDLLSEVVREPAFDAKDLDRVRAEWISGLVAERQNPARMASLIGLRALLGDPHGAPVRGTVGDVQKLRPLDLRRFHGAAFVPKNAALVVVGDVAPAPLPKTWPSSRLLHRSARACWLPTAPARCRRQSSPRSRSRAGTCRAGKRASS
jgi:zinc protease